MRMAWMGKLAAAGLLALAAAVAGAQDGRGRGDDGGGNAVRWQTVIGIIQAGNVVGSGTGAVGGGGQPWSTLGGRAQADLATGRIRFDVEGLVLAGGNGIGTRAAIAQVKGTVVCDTDGSAGNGNSVLVDTPAVALDEQGNARFDGTVSLPAVCSSEPDIAFLVRIAAAAPGDRWIANGAVRR